MHHPGITSGKDREEEAHRSVQPCSASLRCSGVSLVAQTVKKLPARRKTRVQSPGREDPLEKGKVTRSRILAWRVPWTEEAGGLQSVGLQRVGHD